MQLVLLLAVVLATATIALAHGFGSTASPSHYIADSSTHTWISTEGNNAERFEIESIFDARMVSQFNNRTDMSTVKVSSYDTFVDAYWFVTASATNIADATCVGWISQGSNPPVCNQARIRFHPDWLFSATTNGKRQASCHEIGHTVGFDDSQPENDVGCMSGGPNGELSQHEINHLNQQY